MHSTRRLSFRCMLGMAASASLVACERAHVAPPARDSLPAAVAAPAVVSTPPTTGMARTDSIPLTEIATSPSFRPVDAVGTLFSRRFPAMLSSLLYQRWVPDTLSRDAYCQNEEADGYHVHAEWAVARIRLLSLGEVAEPPRSHEDNYLREVNAVVEVVRVGSLDSEPLDDAAAERHQPTTMSVDVKTDTLRLDWRRRDGVWERCGSEWAGSVTPVDLIGPPAAIRKPGPEPLVRSPGASWDRVRALADSVGRAGPELVDARATSAAASAADVDLSGAWATGSTSEPAVSRVVVQLECNYTPSFWIIEQRGDSVRAFTNPESRAQGIRAPDRVQPVTAEGRMVGSLITMSAPGSRYLLRYDPASGHLRGTLNDRPFWAVRQENVRPSGCIPVP